MAHQRIIARIALWIMCIGHLSINLYPNDLATAAQTVAKQHETIINTLGNDELRNQHNLLPYIQDLERNNTALIAAINTTNPELIPTITMMLATDINTIAIGIDPLINDLLAVHNITNPHPIAQQLFKAIIAATIANLVHEAPTPSVEQCRQTSWTISRALETCATVLKADLPLLSPSAEKASAKRRVLTWLWYLTLATATISAGYLLYQYIIKPLQEAQTRIAALNEQIGLAQTTTLPIRQQIEQINKITTISRATSPAQTITRPQTPMLTAPVPTMPTETTEPESADTLGQQETNQILANACQENIDNLTALTNRVTSIERQATQETNALATLTAAAQQPLPPTLAASNPLQKLISFAKATVGTGTTTDKTTPNTLAHLNTRRQQPSAATTAHIDRALQKRIEELPTPPQ